MLQRATGTGKTFTMAHVIQRVEWPTLVIAHNKTLAAQLCTEFRELLGFQYGNVVTDARQPLKELMSDTSEDRYCASWLLWIEYMLWDEVLQLRSGTLPAYRIEPDEKPESSFATIQR